MCQYIYAVNPEQWQDFGLMQIVEVPLIGLVRL